MWSRAKCKRLLNTGQEHVTPKKCVRRARKVGKACQQNCRICKQRLTDEERQHIHNKFWRIGDHTRHWDYIVQHVTVSSPKKTFALPEHEKTVTRKYSFLVQGKPRIVCKTMFLRTLDIPDAWVKTAFNKLTRNGTTVSPDKRGKHTSRRRRNNEATKQSVVDHINKYPRIESNYCRQRSKREYLESGLSILKMYKDYIVWATEQGIKPATARTYREIFNRQFNIGFFKPRKDQCAECNRFKYALPQEKLKLKDSYEHHIKNRNLGNKLKSEDKAAGENSTDICVACFDLQKVLSCPRSETSVFFYRSKLSLYNFTIFDLNLHQGFCYMWTEITAGRGANEVASNLLSFIKMKSESGTKEFRFYSDGPTGQNKNRFVFAQYLLASSKLQVSITHRFLEPGHTHMEVDSMHARIEKEASRKELYVPQEWFELVINSKQEGEKYRVIDVQQSDIYNFKPLVEKQNWAQDINKVKIHWSKVKEVHVSASAPNILKFKYDYEGENFSVNVTQKRGHSVNLVTYELPNVYYSKLPLKPKKIRDIKWLCDTNAIPSLYHGFYGAIINAPVCGDELLEESEEENAYYTDISGDEQS